MPTYRRISYTPSKYYVEQQSIYWRSEEHTSELQSRLHLVCRLLLEKKKKDKKESHADTIEEKNNGNMADLHDTDSQYPRVNPYLLETHDRDRTHGMHHHTRHCGTNS